ncbi:acetoacetate decarboxylase family protein [Antrihabitans stalactiti]|uniref:Acetoacetate decarboxylase n=1 Tax=Antrihabitans stalactiti TaxID=2584121 RepID=A0A848KLE4_9NOCA|nr:acetoacetate decarboxylase family protein [Antrihabitans stalactiti]NMN99011.1 acetoacetate decarboxylase [Antrihabitans stalactiti]
MNSTQDLVEVDFGGTTVDVPRGGYYDRYRSNPNLDEIAQDPAAGNIDWFRRIPKVLVDSRVGPIWAPNFYYRAGIVQVLMLAPLDRVRAALPEPLEPLSPIPGQALVALTFFSYSVCDNDPYDEVSVAVVVRRPGARGPHALELAESMRRRSYYAHVLALPVNTEIARARGVNGYQLPKWKTDISLAIDDTVTAQLDGPTGPDVTLQTPTPGLQKVPSQSRFSTNTMLHLVDGQWHQTSVQTNVLEFASQTLPGELTITRHGGPVSQLLDGLGASKVLRLDVTKDAQLVLNLPRPLTAFDK